MFKFKSGNMSNSAADLVSSAGVNMTLSPSSDTVVTDLAKKYLATACISADNAEYTNFNGTPLYDLLPPLLVKIYELTEGRAFIIGDFEFTSIDRILATYKGYCDADQPRLISIAHRYDGMGTFTTMYVYVNVSVAIEHSTQRTTSYSKIHDLIHDKSDGCIVFLNTGGANGYDNNDNSRIVQNFVYSPADDSFTLEQVLGLMTIKKRGIPYDICEF